MVNVWGGECLGGERLTIGFVSVADVDAEEFVADSLVGILMMRFGKGVELFYFGHDIEAEVWSRF